MRGITEKFDAYIQEGQAYSFPSVVTERTSDGTPVALSPSWCSWIGRVELLIEGTFGMQSAVGRALTAGTTIAVVGCGQYAFMQAKAQILGALTFARDAINERYPLRGPIGHADLAAVANGRIFVVHGHDHEAKAELEIALTSWGLDPVVLHRQPDQGATLLEKFERHSDVSYAFILLTPDELAFTVDQALLDERERKLEKRARPNVIFEFGFFAGRLGRDRVCCLYKGGVELPTDLKGFVYKDISNGIESQGLALIKELRAAGFAITV